MDTIITFLRLYPEQTQALGLIGFAIYVGGFYMVQAEIICGNGNGFATTQVLAALLVLISLSNAFNLASCLIQLSYASIGLFGILRRVVTKASKNPSYCSEISPSGGHHAGY